MHISILIVRLPECDDMYSVFSSVRLCMDIRLRMFMWVLKQSVEFMRKVSNLNVPKITNNGRKICDTKKICSKKNRFHLK